MFVALFCIFLDSQRDASLVRLICAELATKYSTFVSLGGVLCTSGRITNCSYREKTSRVLYGFTDQLHALMIEIEVKSIIVKFYLK